MQQALTASADTVGPFSLFEALSRFTAADPILTPALAKSTDLANWKAAIESLADIVHQVVQNTDWNPAMMFSAVGVLKNITDHYQITDIPLDPDTQRKITLTWDPEQGASSFATEITVEALGPDLKQYTDHSSGTVDNGITYSYKPVPPLENDFVTHQIQLEGLNVLAAENATAGLQIQRNIIKLGNSEIREEFTYTTGLVSFSNPVTPFIVNDTALDVAQLPNQTGSQLQERIFTMMNDLLNNALHTRQLLLAMQDSGQGDSAPRRVKVECNYQYPIAAADGTVPANPIWVTIPVALARSFDIDPQSEQLKDFSQQYANFVNDWSSVRTITYGTESKQPKGSRFVFDITLYALLSGTNTPLLELANLQLKMTDIDAST
jgi:hypothetical protein